MCSYGLLDTLNAKFQIDLNVTAARAGGLQAAYFGAYFIGPLTWGGWVVRKFGFRWTFITGLVVYGIGALMFWPSAKFSSFGGFCASLFIVGGGLSVCRRTPSCANEYITDHDTLDPRGLCRPLPLNLWSSSSFRVQIGDRSRLPSYR